MDASFDRSQPIFKIPIDRWQVSLVLHDGEAVDGALFIATGEPIETMFDKPEPFVPVATASGVRLLARATIASIAVVDMPILPLAAPTTERQRVHVRLRSGAYADGELRWTAPSDRRRTVDHLNDSASCLTVHAANRITYIAKAHVAWVKEA